MAYLVIKKFYKDKAGRLMLLIEGKLTDRNFWIDKKENKYSVCLEDHVLRAIPVLYPPIVAYNEGKLNDIKNFIKDIRKRRHFYIV